MSWQRLADLILRRPVVILLGSLVVLTPPAFALPAMRTSFDQLAELPESADSVKGFAALEGSFDPGDVQPMIVMVRSRRSLWNDEAFEAIDDLTVNLEKVPGVTVVRSVTRPTGGRVTQEQMEAAGLGDVDALTERLPRAIQGIDRLVAGLRRMRDGLVRIRASVPDQRSGIARGIEGIDAMRDGLARIRAGLGRLGAGLGRAEDGVRRLAERVAEPALAATQAAWQDLREASLLTRLDPQYEDLARHVGRALAILSGRCPSTEGIGPQPASCPAGEKLDPGYDGLEPTLRRVADGLARAQPGIERISSGLARIDDGLGRLAGGLGGGEPQLDRLESGVGHMIGGLDRAVPGLQRLRRGLRLGSSLIEDIGLIPDPGDEVALTASIVRAFPKLRSQLTLFMGEEGRATRLFVILDRPPYEARALETSRDIREIAPLSLRETSLDDAEVFVAGTPAFFSDVSDSSSASFDTILWVVVGGIFLILVLLLRSIVSPLYLVATVLLSFAATLGLTVIVFQGFLHHAGLTWWLPAFLFVILVALGADYNIFLMGRIREEAGNHDTRTAVTRGLAATGRVITSAGMILAGTFAALVVSPLQGLVQFGFATTVGLLIDTFIVRSLLVPSIAVLVGSASWWPSKRAARA